MDKKMIEELIKAAKNVLPNAYAPYSHFDVGAAVLMESGAIYTGVNVENSAYSTGTCAERNAIYHAIAEGEKRLKAIAIISGKNAGKGEPITDYASPCGMCRQAMREFCDPKELTVILARSETDYVLTTLEELLPNSFGPESL